MWPGACECARESVRGVGFGVGVDELVSGALIYIYIKYFIYSYAFKNILYMYSILFLHIRGVAACYLRRCLLLSKELLEGHEEEVRLEGPLVHLVHQHVRDAG